MPEVEHDFDEEPFITLVVNLPGGRERQMFHAGVSKFFNSFRHLGLWKESQAPLERDPPVKQLTYGSINSPSRGRSRDSQLI